MRALRSVFCAVAVSACLAPGVARADEFTKQTFLTFSGPVQLPGITLAAGTYEFKLADPESGRSLVQVWDKDGSNLITTLLTIPDQRMKPSEDPVVTFGERPSGEPMPIRSWFYPTDTYGQEFVYPKDQAMKIAKDTHSSVLAFNDETKDASEYKSAKIGRMDENGRLNNSQSASTATSGSASTTADERSNPAAQSSTAQSDASLSTPARSASAQPAEPSPSTAVGTSGTTTTAPAAADTTSEANRDNIPSNRAVVTSGTTADTASANRTGQAAAGANAAAPRANTNNQAAPATRTTDNARTLPHTAGSMTLVQLLAGLSLAAAFGLRTMRARSAHTR